jgi:predicted nucleic acid-binding protein
MGSAAVTQLDDALWGVRHLGFDSAPIIYYVEAQPTYAPLMASVFQRIGSGQLEGMTSTITLVEVLTKPRASGDEQLAETYRNLLLDSEYFQTVPIGAPVAELAAQLRARYGLRTPDALQIAVALAEGCEAFLTNDTRLRQVTELPILQVAELEL